MKRRQTPSQTVGPYFAYGLTPEQYGYPFKELTRNRLRDADTDGERISIVGRVFDGAGDVIPDAMIEIWQADAQGRYAHPADPRGSNIGFKGFGRFGTGTDPENRFQFDTIKPGAIGDGQAPHINVIVFMRGILLHAYTRLYFSDEAAANVSDPVWSALDAGRRDTLIAERQETDDGVVYHFDIHMQGDRETVFFDA
jgi:protocatechuate 3,4-dioxygenase alpha subunit